MSILEQVVRALEDFVLVQNGLDTAGRIPFEHGGKTEYGYPYIRSAHESFETALLASSRLIPPPAGAIRFLEVGCGLGTKCEIARLHGMQATGIDLKQEYVQLARTIFPDCTFARANALDFDYSEQDLVYSHVPFFDDSLLFQLELRILSQLPVGRVLFVTRLSDALQQAISNQQGIKPALRATLSDPGIDLGRIHVLQKTAPLATNLLESLLDSDDRF
jgi:SAM-dependent methyltransferase